MENCFVITTDFQSLIDHPRISSISGFLSQGLAKYYELIMNFHLSAKQNFSTDQVYKWQNPDY